MRTLCAQEIAGPGSQHNQRGDAYFEEGGVIAEPRILTLAVGGGADLGWRG